MQVAVLSKDYEPLTYCDVERAITLLYLNKAESIKDSNQFIRSVTSKFRIPKVIRLLYKTAKRFIPTIKYSRKSVHKRDNYTCQYCGHTKDLSIDHIMPVSRGGKSTWENTVTACQKCNSKKGNKTPEEAGMYLKRAPMKPNIMDQVNWDDFLH
jgi:5-methylcytosine-specific restriction endonuclease McrA